MVSFSGRSLCLVDGKSVSGNPVARGFASGGQELEIVCVCTRGMLGMRDFRLVDASFPLGETLASFGVATAIELLEERGSHGRTRIMSQNTLKARVLRSLMTEYRRGLFKFDGR